MMEQRQAGGLDVNVLAQRVRRLAMLDTTVFEEMRVDRNGTVPAMIIAGAAMFLFGLGGWLWWIVQNYNYDSGEFLFKSAIFGSILGFVLWAGAIIVTYVMLTQMFSARVDFGELIRVAGLAAAPLALGLLLFVWEIGYAISLISVLLTYGATVVAVQTVTDASPGKVVAATGAGFAIWAIILTLFGGGDDWLAPNLFLFSPD